MRVCVCVGGGADTEGLMDKFCNKYNHISAHAMKHTTTQEKEILNLERTMFQTVPPPPTLSDLGYLRQLTIQGGGGVKTPPPIDIENYCINLHHIIHVHFTRCLGMFQLGIFQKFAILTIL